MSLPDKLMVSLRLSGGENSLTPKVVATFHEWIASHALGEVLIDVADYSHVPGGPGVVLIGYDYNYSVAARGQQVELACCCKRNAPGDNPLLNTLRRLLEACRLLQAALCECDVQWQAAGVEVTVFDRKLTDHYPFRTAEFAWLVAEHLGAVCGERPQVTVAVGTARPTVHAAWASPTSVDALLERLQGAARTAASAGDPLAQVLGGAP